MKISVILPNYNHAAFLRERIESILAQTRKPDEIIFLDDASTDTSLQIAKEFDCFSKVIVNKENSGSPFKQWLKGIDSASGDYVWIAESDDACDPRMLERLAGEAERGAVLAFCRSVETGPEGESLGIQRYQAGFREDFTMDGPAFVRKYLSRRNVVANASAALFRRDAALRVDPAFTGFHGAGDILFWAGLARQGKVSFVAEPLNRFRQHGGNRTSEDALSGRGLHESLLVYRELERQGALDSCQFRQIVADNRYRLLYGLPSLPEEVRKTALEEWDGGFPVDFLVALKRIKRKLWK